MVIVSACLFLATVSVQHPPATMLLTMLAMDLTAVKCFVVAAAVALVMASLHSN